MSGDGISITARWISRKSVKFEAIDANLPLMYWNLARLFISDTFGGLFPCRDDLIEKSSYRYWRTARVN